MKSSILMTSRALLLLCVAIAMNRNGLAQQPAGMVLIPGGSNAGSDPDTGSYCLTVPSFYMDCCEVTKAKWDEVRNWGLANGYTDLVEGEGKGGGYPVVTVNWYDVVKWCNARSEMEGRIPVYFVDAGLGAIYKTGESAPSVNTLAKGYRLPTETEWEYAARGGVSGKRFPWGSDTIDNNRGNYMAGALTDLFPYDHGQPDNRFSSDGLPYTSPVGSFAANGYGLYDMMGNATEWCYDWKSGGQRSQRGGSWITAAGGCTVAFRGGHDPNLRRYTPPGCYANFGFRAVLPLGERYALIVGINTYAHPYPQTDQPDDMPYCINDALCMKDKLLQGNTLWNSSNIKLLLSGEATKAAISSELRRLAAQTTPADVVLYYQSSHGGWVNGTTTAALLAYDQLYMDSDLASDLSTFNSGCSVVIVIDACHSAGMFERAAVSVAATQMTPWNFAQGVMDGMKHPGFLGLGLTESTVSGQPSLGWMTACDWNQNSRDAGTHGRFTNYLLQGFSAGDKNNDGLLTFRELFDHASFCCVRDSTLLNFGGDNQFPQILDASGILAGIVAGRRTLGSTVASGWTLGATRSALITSKDAPWVTQSNIVHNSQTAAQSGSIMDCGVSQMETSIDGPGSFSFWYKVSSETNSDYLDFVLDGTNLVHASGEVPWSLFSCSITSGTHTACWSYSKDSSNAVAPDCAWIGDVSWQPLDSDGDGMPDAWMQFAFSHANAKTNDHSLAQDDADGDGMSNLAEYLADTDPRDSNSCLRFGVGSVSSNVLNVECHGGIHAWELLESSTNLEDWFPVQTNVPPLQPVFSVALPAGRDEQFYRLRIVQ